MAVCRSPCSSSWRASCCTLDTWSRLCARSGKRKAITARGFVGCQFTILLFPGTLTLPWGTRSSRIWHISWTCWRPEWSGGRHSNRQIKHSLTALHSFTVRPGSNKLLSKTLTPDRVGRDVVDQCSSLSFFFFLFLFSFLSHSFSFSTLLRSVHPLKLLLLLLLLRLGSDYY